MESTGEKACLHQPCRGAVILAAGLGKGVQQLRENITAVRNKVVLDHLGGQLIRHGCKGFQEILNAGPLGLHLMDFRCDRVQSGLGLLESLGQAVVAFLVFGLVEGNVCVFVDALLNHIGDHLRLLLEFFLLSLQVGGVKEQGHHFPAIRDDCILGGQELICRWQESLLDDVIGQVRSAAMLVAVEFVIALPDDLPVLAVGVPYL